MNNHKRKKALLFLLFPVILFAVTGIVMWLWNLLLPEILGVKAISFWQAMGILVLSKILFGGFRGKCGGFGNFREKHMMRKMQGMTEEEQEKFREKMKEKFGNNPFCK